MRVGAGSGRLPAPGPARVLVVEDEPRLAALLADYLRAAGHEPECVADGAGVLAIWQARRHDLVLLDLMLPGRDGLALCRDLRACSAVPIVMLTARADEADRLAGLEGGADDYITKNPFSPREVVARVNAVLRRSRAVAAVALPPLQVDEAGLAARWQGRLLELTPIEFRLLRVLSAQPGRVYPRAQLLEHLHGDGRAVTERAVDSHVKNLRRKLEQAGAGSQRIRTLYGVGYCYEA
ncbi:response regulator [Pseudorhodoferax sp.]|uniref:response regulator n=1 Tax=Pseudorhodoferax sp. TaxID=1993553 RepID=UPI002DD64A56|nr:response regulator [Pseudorhodoferax sp.]